MIINAVYINKGSFNFELDRELSYPFCTLIVFYYVLEDVRIRLPQHTLVNVAILYIIDF